MTMGKMKNFQGEMGRMTSPIDNLVAIKRICELDKEKPENERTVYMVARRPQLTGKA